MPLLLWKYQTALESTFASFLKSTNISEAFVTVNQLKVLNTSKSLNLNIVTSNGKTFRKFFPFHVTMIRSICTCKA